MPTYVALCNFTQEGIQNIKQSPSRFDKVKKAIRVSGGKLKSFYLTMGRYDIVAVAEWPDDESAAKFMLTLGSHGNVRSETLKAFPEAEYRKLIKDLP